MSQTRIPFSFRSSWLFRVTVFALLAVVMTPLSAQATGVGSGDFNSPVAVSTTTNVNSMLTNPMVATGFPETMAVLAVISTTAGYLSETATTGLSTVTGYQTNLTDTGTSIAFSGAPSAVNAALATVRVTTPGTGGAAQISLSVTARGSNSVAYNSANGHYYEYVSTGTDWVEAFNAITGASLANSSSVYDTSTRVATPSTNCPKTFNGMCGYFATVTTASENSFVTNKVGSAAAWLGGSDRRYEGVWKWEDPKAPEYDKQFSDQGSIRPARVDQTGVSHAGTGSNGTGQPISYLVAGVTYSYANWNNNEPNNSSNDENALQLLSGGTGKWNDLPESGLTGANKMGYIIEYGGNGESLLYPAATRTINLVIPPIPAPTFGSVTRIQNGFTVQISNFSDLLTYETTTVTAGTVSIDANGLMTVSGLPYLGYSTVTLRAKSQGELSSTNTVTGRALPAAAPAMVGDYALVHNGTSQYSSTANQIIPASGAFTVEAWVNPANGVDANPRVILSQGSGSHRFYLKRLNGKFVFMADGFGAEVTCGTFPQNQWSHLAVTVSGTTAKCYLNGNLQINSTVSAASTIGSGFYVGGYSHSITDANTKWVGKIDEVKVWNVARTISEIQATKNAAPALNASGLVAYYDFNEGAGVTVHNRLTGAASGTHLTTTGTPTWDDLVSQSANGSYTVTTFTRTYITSSGGWTVPNGVGQMDMFIVGGGGGGGVDAGSGGAGGGIHLRTAETVTGGSSISIVVGVGGSAGIYNTSAAQTNGEDSVVKVGSSTFTGGGGNAGATGLGTSPQPAAAVGGLGSGAGGTNYQGSSGGAGRGWATGAGSGTAGVAGTQLIDLRGDNKRYGAGGAGGADVNGNNNMAVVLGGAGGGGNAGGLIGTTYTDPTDGLAGTGSGGGAGLAHAQVVSHKSSAAGGSGIVMLRYWAAVFTSTTPTYPNLTVGESSTQNVRVTNAGSATLIFVANGIFISGANPEDFSLTAESCTSVPVAITDSCTASVQFAPTATGTRTATLYFQSNAFGTYQAVDLVGIGITSPAPIGTPGNGNATVKVFTPGGHAPDTYTVTSSPGGFSCTITSPADSCTVTGLSNGTSYTFTSSAYQAGVLVDTSLASDPITPLSGVNTAAPVLTGIPAVGSVLTVSGGTWTGATSDTKYVYQWETSTDLTTWSVVPGETQTTYTPVVADMNKYVRALVKPILNFDTSTVASNATLFFVKGRLFNADDFTIAANATLSGLEVSLTPATAAQMGAVFSNSRVSVRDNFAISALINLGSSDAGADGLAFVMQPNSVTTLSSGGGLGYDGVPTAFALEFDTFKNGSEPVNDHASLNKSSATVHDAWGASVIDLGNIEDGNYRSLEIIWVAAANTTGCTTGQGKFTARYDQNYNGIFEAGDVIYDNVCLNLESYFSASNANAYFGFTAATGGAMNLQQVKDIAYSTTSRINTAPVVGTASNQNIQKGSGLQSFTIPVTDDNTSADQWTVTITSSNTSVVPTVSVATPYPTLTGGSGNFTIRYTPDATTTGTSTITLKIVDADGASRTQTFVVTVTDYVGLVLATPTTGLSATNGSAFSLTLSATGGSSSTYTFSSNSTFPAGIFLDPNTGVISGTPTANGTFTLTIDASDTASATSSATFSIVVAAGSSGNSNSAPVYLPPAPVITNPVIPPLTGGNPLNFVIQAPNATNFVIAGGALPAGLSLNPTTGAVTGTPTVSGPYSFTVKVTNTFGQSSLVTYSGTIAPANTNGGANGNSSAGSGANGTGASNAPKLDPVIPVVAPKPGNIQVTVDGAAIPAAIVPNTSKTGLEVIASDWKLTLAAKTPAGSAAPLNSSSQIIFEKSHGVDVSGSGFAPNTEVKVYIFSTPILLGTVKTDAQGKFNAVLPMPAEIKVGDHTLQVNGVSSNNEVRSASVGVVVEETAKGSATSANNAGANQVVISFAFGKYQLTTTQLAKLKKLLLTKNVVVKVAGYAQNTDGQHDIAVSLNRAIEVKKQILKINSSAKVSVIGMGHKTQKLCTTYINKCAVATIGK